MEKAREFQKEIFLCFVDYSKAFDCVGHTRLWNFLQELGIPKYLIELIKNLYTNQEATVKTEYGNTDWFNIGKGVRQGCNLSPYLFNIYAEYTMKQAGFEETTTGIKVGGRNINNLRYIDATILMAESAEDLRCLLGKLKKESLAAGLKLNINKTFVMTTGSMEEFKIGDEETEIVQDFTFLESRINNDGNCSPEINRPLILGRQSMINLDNLMKSRNINMNTSSAMDGQKKKTDPS